MDRLERLVNLVAALLDADRPLTRAELRARVGGYSDDDDAFRRNFERDKDTLRQMGLPLETVALDPDRHDEPQAYQVRRERYELPDPGLSDEELTALRIAASAVRPGGPWGDEAPRGALRKLAAVAGEPAAGAVRPPGDGPTAAAPGLAELTGSAEVVTAFSAVAERRRLRFGYHGEERVVDPWGLSYRAGHWYLSGYDHGRADERLFRLDRVDGGGLRLEGEPAAFDRPPGRAARPIPPWRLGDEPETEVTVLVDADQAPWAEASAGGEAVVERRPDGSVVLMLRVTNRGALRSWLLGFLEHAELLGPPDARAEVVDWLAALAGAPA